LLLRVASIVAPADPATVGAFLQASTSESFDVRREVLWALPRLELPGGIRGELVANALERTNVAEVEEALLVALQLEDVEFRALEGALRSAWLRARPSDVIVDRAAAALFRLDLEPSELIDLCGRRIRMEHEHGKFAAATLLGNLPESADDELHRAIRGSRKSDRVFWLGALPGRAARSEALLVELARAAGPTERPFVLNYLAIRSELGDDALELFAEELAEPTSPGGQSVLRGLAMFGVQSEGILDPLLERFEEFPAAEQQLILRAAVRCDPGSKRLAAVAREALPGSRSDAVRAWAAAALAQGHGPVRSRTKALRAALKRGGLPASSVKTRERKDRGGGLDLALMDQAAALREENGPQTVAAIAEALADLGVKSASTLDDLGNSLGGRRLQTVMCA
ncbi:MAG: hypothetical protein AAFP86_16320, partial [Planctomycetota bacterium]